MKVSVIVPTRNGAHKLPKVLQSLLAQDLSDFELIVSVDGSTDDTRTVLDAWLPKFPAAHALYSDNGGRSKARNRGAASAGGELLIFVDDDMRLEPDAIRRHAEHHERVARSLASGAQVYDARTATDDFQRYKSVISQAWCREIERYYPDPLPIGKLHLTAANFSVPKELFVGLGGFDDSVPDMEDFLLAYMATQQGIPVYYLHAAFGWHDDPADLFAMQQRYVQYKQAARIVAQRYPEIAAAFPRYRTVTPLFRRWMSAILSARIFGDLVCNNTRIPEGLRYRLYGALLHAPAERN